MYVSALKDYKKIVKSYLVGIIIAGIVIWILTHLFHQVSATAVFFGLVMGFFFIMMMLMNDIYHFFQINNKKYYQFLVYIEKYPQLFLIGLFYYLGLYGQNIAAWFSKHGMVVNETFIIAPYYDTPVFYAYLSILPALILFMVSVETSFYKAYKQYYGRILNGFPLQDIETAKHDMYRVLKLEILFLTQVQLLVTFIFLFLGVRFLPFLGLTQDQITIFIIVVISNWFFSLIITIFLVLLYFDERKAALMLIGSYAILSFLLSLILMIGFSSYGTGMFIANLAVALLGIGLLISRLNEIDYTTFCSQPIIYKETITNVEKMLKKLGHLD